jgi:hypothetical protein
MTLPGAVIHRPAPGGWHPRMPERLDEENWRTGAPAAMRVYRLAALTIGAGIVAANESASIPNVPAMSAIRSYKT